jgi:hypothetical protein
MPNPAATAHPEPGSSDPLDQLKVLALKQGKLSGFSIERPMRLVLRLGRDIEITVINKDQVGSSARLRVAS